MRGALLRTYSVPEQRSAHEHRSQLLNILLVTSLRPGGASYISLGQVRRANAALGSLWNFGCALKGHRRDENANLMTSRVPVSPAPSGHDAIPTDPQDGAQIVRWL